MAHRLDTVWAGARDGLWDLNVSTGTLHVSPQWAELLGHSVEDVEERSEEWFRRVHPRDLEPLRRAIDAHVEGQTERLEVEFRIRHRDGSWRWILCCGSRHPEVPLIGGSFTDVTALKKAENRILMEAFHDPLTGLPNRRLFIDRLGLALARQRQRPSAPLAVIYLDLDRFHDVNESLGVDAGDDLLVELTRRLTSTLRLGDTLGRAGGDKFTMLLDGVAGPREVMHFAAELSKDLSRPVMLRGEEVMPSCGIGIALSHSGTERPEDLVSEAVSAMHRAKQDGSGQFRLYDPETNAQAKERLRLEADLRHAVERGELVLHYQPIVSFRHGGLTSFEALLRWQHPTRGLIRPDAFIPLAEESGQILPMGRWVLEEACRQMREWHERYPESADVSVAVNLSGRQFQNDRLLDEVEGCLEASRLDPSKLHLEVTESVVMARTRANQVRLRELRELGIKLLIDDFGTGYSSLASLQSFALDALKIDRSFISGLEFEENKAEIVSTILALARALDLEVVAEGIETVEALEMLRGLQCQHGQGFFFSGPMDGESAGAWMGNPPRY